jgi:hypothetical protein
MFALISFATPQEQQADIKNNRAVKSKLPSRYYVKGQAMEIS